MHLDAASRWQILFQVAASGKVGFAGGLESGNPSPRKRVRCGIAIEQMTTEELRTELPGQAFDMDPPSREPHAGVVVKITGFDQLPGEMVHDRHGAFASFASVGPGDHHAL